jgi:hypothetical protein
MPDINKLILKMKRQPNGIRFQELAKVLEYNGYNMKPKKRNITQTIYKHKRWCDYDKRRKSIKGSVC